MRTAYGRLAVWPASSPPLNGSYEETNCAAERWRDDYPRRLIGALATSSTLHTVSTGIATSSASSSSVGSRADLQEHLARGAHDLVDRPDDIPPDRDGHVPTSFCTNRPTNP